MKSAVIGIIVVIITVTTFIILSTIQSNVNKTDEITDALTNSMYNTQQEWVESDIKTDDEYINILKENIDKQLVRGKEVTYSLEVYGVDASKGFLDVGITSKYKNAQKKEREVYTRKTIIVDKSKKE